MDLTEWRDGSSVIRATQENQIHPKAIMNRHSVPNALRALPGVVQNGGSSPRFYDFDDGVPRLVKWHPSSHGPKVCFNELVASRLAQLIDVPLLRGCVVYIPDAVIPPDHRAFAKPGFNFGVYRMKGGNFIADKHLATIHNLDEFPIAAAHLAWLQVADQEYHNQYKQEVEDPADPKNIKYLYRLADMGFIFGVGNNGSWTAATLGKLDAYRLPRHLADNVKVDQMAAAVSEIEKVAEDDIRSCFEDVPSDWGIDAADIAGAVQWVIAARLNLKPLLAKGNPGKFNFPMPAQAPNMV